MQQARKNDDQFTVMWTEKMQNVSIDYKKQTTQEARDP